MDCIGSGRRPPPTQTPLTRIPLHAIKIITTNHSETRRKKSNIKEKEASIMILFNLNILFPISSNLLIAGP